MPVDGGSSEQLDALLRAATGHAILLTDLDGVLTMFSEGAEGLLGYPAEEVVGRHTPDLFFAPGELARAAAELGVPARFADIVAIAVDGSHWTRDWAWLSASGEQMTVRLAITAVVGGQGGHEAYLGIGTDVTAEARANAEVKTAEAKWRTLLETLPATGIIILDEDLRYRTAVGSALDPAGQLDLIGKTIYEALPATDAVTLEMLARTALGGAQAADEVQFASGRTFELSAIPSQDRRGQPEALIVAHDVTVDRHREHSLRIARERFRRLFDEAPNGMALTSLGGQFIQINPTVGRIFGVDLTDLVGRSVWSVAATEDDEAVIRRYLADLTAAPEGRLTEDWTVRGANSQLVYVSASGVVLLDERGQPESILLNLSDISQRRLEEQRMAHLAHHDPLTGLANRRRFDSELTAHLERCRRYGATGALMALDLDHFKQVNDTMGHAAGDQLIVAAADALRHRLRTSDVVARMGGDEFAILLPNVDRAAAAEVATSIVKLIRDEVKVFDGDTPHSVTTSVGVVLIDKTDVTTAELLVAADLTMYEAKQAGRDRHAISDSDVIRPARSTVAPSWADRIATALGEQRLLLHAQPVFSTATKEQVGAELLVRMLYEDDELILPERFLYVAERVGLMPSIDLWVVNRALECLAKLSHAQPDLQLHVNISAMSMADDDLVSTVINRIRESGVDPSRLVFEVTEAAAASRLEAARTFTEAISHVGCELALDDFGAGFGSFYYLKHLRFDTVKVSGELVTKSVMNKTDRMILLSILDLAHDLGKKIIAEKVEDATMMNAVSRQKIDYAQGYHLGRPKPVAELLGPIIGGLEAPSTLRS